MKTERSWSFKRDEMLIELVKAKPGLYDLQSPRYSDNNYKRSVWQEIEKAVGQSGAKTRWESLRGQYRKYLAKTKRRMSEEPTGKFRIKWRYHDQMLFLSDHINSEGPRTSSITNEENDIPIGAEVDAERDVKDSLLLQMDREDVESENDGTNSLIHQKRRKPMGVVSSSGDAIETLLKYILEKQEEERNIQPIDHFFKLMADTVKHFSPVEQHYVKTKVFNLVNEIEGKYLASPSTSYIPAASTSLPSHSVRYSQ
ncbi:uncharacterized protein LOC117220505 [Megalopta genalis]|uniref:uncharacterized protein LOC117220505 n=1 Tax=Megalopta genalis TaxID=115081 RepID=UPI0014432649|nr:uncharacterized protein LOC117220505 [Megalopta genalis]